MRKPSIPPTGPPRASQSSIRTTQPTPIMVPKPKVKYSTVLSPPRRFTIAADYIRRKYQHPSFRFNSMLLPQAHSLHAAEHPPDPDAVVRPPRPTTSQIMCLE